MVLGTAEVASLLGLDANTVQKLALEVDVADREQVAGALKSRRIPASKISRAWIFVADHVQAFRDIDRPTGRPRKTA